MRLGSYSSLRASAYELLFGKSGREEMKRIVLIVGAAIGLGACQPAATPVADVEPGAEAPAAPEPAGPVEAATWDVELSPVLALKWGSDGLSISCEEAKGVLRLAFEPAWEKEGPFDKAVVHFGDKSFPVTIETPAVGTPDANRPVYVLPANADTVTAVMLANNARLVVSNQDGEQERGGDPTDNGAFDMFATTCAQINGLR